MSSLEPSEAKVLPLRLPLDPRYPAEDIFALVNPDIRKPFDMQEVILRIVDDSRLSIFKPKYGPTLFCGWASIHGYTTGIIANQTPIIYADEAVKGAHFIRACNQQYVVARSAAHTLID